MKISTLFDRRFAAALLIILGALLAISPAGLRQPSHFSPQELVAAVASESDHVTAEDLSAWIIDKKPDLQIVDIRSSEEYTQYHIPGTVNIPLTQLFDEDSQELLDRDKIIVLYSNGGTHAAQAWVMLKQMGIDSYVLLGGLNYWAEAILNPKAPNDLVADSEILKYQFRKSASDYFAQGGIAPAQSDTSASQSQPKVKIDLQKKKKGRAGC
jgi:rhodanese-related sulfurtransferase